METTLYISSYFSDNACSRKIDSVVEVNHTVLCIQNCSNLNLPSSSDCPSCQTGAIVTTVERYWAMNMSRRTPWGRYEDRVVKETTHKEGSAAVSLIQRRSCEDISSLLDQRQTPRTHSHDWDKFLWQCSPTLELTATKHHGFIWLLYLSVSKCKNSYQSRAESQLMLGF